MLVILSALILLTILLLIGILINSLFFLAAGKIFRVSQLTYKKALSICLLILLSVFLLRIATALFYAIGTGKNLVEILAGIASFLIAIWIIKKKVNITTFRSVGVYLTSVVLFLVFVLFLRSFVVQAYMIPSGGMLPTLLVGDHILVNKFIYGIKAPFINKTIIPLGKPKRGDTIVFIYPLDRKKDFIKRVIGLPGEQIEIINKKIFINGKLFDGPFGVYDKNSRGNNNLGPIVVPPDGLFVMGDNRDHSYDSRYWGFVPLESVKGKAVIIYWSWPHWKRFGHLVR